MIPTAAGKAAVDVPTEQAREVLQAAEDAMLTLIYPDSSGRGLSRREVGALAAAVALLSRYVTGVPVAYEAAAFDAADVEWTPADLNNATVAIVGDVVIELKP